MGLAAPILKCSHPDTSDQAPRISSGNKKSCVNVMLPGRKAGPRPTGTGYTGQEVFHAQPLKVRSVLVPVFC